MLEYSMDGAGFSPLFRSDGWLCARNGYQKGLNDFSANFIIDRHSGTNEAFTLLKGAAVILTAGKGDLPEKFIATPLSLYKVYLVEKGEWHCALFDEDGLALIVENSELKREENTKLPLAEPLLSEARAALAMAKQL